MDRVVPEAARRDHALLDHERRLLDRLARIRLVVQLARVRPLSGRLLHGQLVREVAAYGLLGEPTDQRDELTDH